jgi:anti-sigma B factor antagonist
MEVRVAGLTAGEMPYVVEVGGDIDIATVVDLEEPVIQAIRDGRRPVIVDLTECVFIDSSGIRLLLRAHHGLQDNGGNGGNGGNPTRLAVIARDHVARMLKLTSLDNVIPVVPSRAEAEGVLAGALRA